MYFEEVDRSSSSDSAEESAEAIFGDSMTVDEQRAALDAAIDRDLHKVDQFCDWWPVGYPAHNGGVLNRLRPCDRNAADTLIVGTGRTLERLHAMAILCWATKSDGRRGSDRWYIANSDRSICVVLQKATFLEREVVRLRLDDPQEHPPEQVSDDLAEHVYRVCQRLGELVRTPVASTPTSLAEAIARVAQELSTIELGDRLVGDYRASVIERLELLDVELIREAHAGADLEVMRRMRTEADQELAGFRQGMTREAYQRACDAAVDRLVREHYGLPTVGFGPGAVSAESDESPKARTA